MEEVKDDLSNKLNRRREQLLTGALIGTLAFIGIGSYIYDPSQPKRRNTSDAIRKPPNKTVASTVESNRILERTLEPTATEIGSKTLAAISGKNNDVVIRTDPYKKHGVVINIKSSAEGAVYEMKVRMLKENNTLKPATTYGVRIRQYYYDINYGAELKINKGGDPQSHDENMWYGSIESSSDLAKGDTVTTHVFDPSALGVITMHADRVADETLKAATEALDFLAVTKPSI